MGQIRLNGVLYSTSESTQVNYGSTNVASAIESFTTEINDKPTLALVTEEEYEDKEDNVVYFIDGDNDTDVSANNINYDNTYSKAKSLNVQDAIDELYLEATKGKSGIVAAVNENGGSASMSDSWNSLNTQMGSLGKSKYKDSYDYYYEKSLVENRKGTATANDVIEGKTFSNASGTDIAGTMANNGAVNQTYSPTSSVQTYTIPSGYHNGSGTVKLNASEIVTRSPWQFYLSHRHYKGATTITEINVQGYKTLSKTMSDTANTSSASIIGYKTDGTSTTLNTTIGDVSGINIEPYYKIRITSVASSSVDDTTPRNIKYIGNYTITA